MVQVSDGDIGRYWGVLLIDDLAGNVCHRFGGAVEQVWGVNSPHRKNAIYAEKDARVRRKR